MAATHCDIRLADGFILNLGKFTTTSADDAQKGSPISLSTTAEVRVSALGSAQLIAGKEGAGLRVVDGQTLAVYPNGSKLMLVEGGTGGAGIGGGYRESCGNITIEGGKLRAVGNQEGSGIGDGAIAKSASSRAKILINQADVTALSGANAPGIGSTQYAVPNMEISIANGSTVVAEGSGRSAGIGVSWRSEGSCTIGIHGGATVRATGGSSGGAGIGSATDSTTTMQINIGNAKVTAIGGDDAAGIGGGDSSKTPTVTITGGTVFAKGDPDVVSVNDIGTGRSPKTSVASSVSGGSVCLANGKGRLMRDGTALNCVTVGGLPVNTSVSVSLTTSKGTYGSQGICADVSGCIYLWVPPANYGSIRVNNVTYSADATSGNAMAYPVQPPANDNFANAKVVSGAAGRVSGSTVAATEEDGLYVFVTSSRYYADNKCSVWYSWTAPFTGEVCFQAEVLQEDYESLGGYPGINAFEGTSGSSLQYADGSSNWACSPSDEGFYGGRVRFNCTKGTTYKIRVYSYYGVEFPAFALAWDTFDKADKWVASFGGDGTATITKYITRNIADRNVVTCPASLFGCQVTEIGDNACDGLSKITSVTISEGVTKIGNYAFNECSGLTSVTLPASLTKIGNYAFSRTGIASLTIPSTVTKLGNNAFAWCESLKNLTIGSGVETIGMTAFAGSGLTSVTIPARVRNMGVYAFGWCESLKTVMYMGGCPGLIDDDGGPWTIEGDYLYGNSPDDLVSVVPAGDDTWADALAAGTWMARAIRTGGGTCKVTFHANGGTVSPTTRSVTTGAAVGTLPVPTLDGYDFVGWFTAKSSGTQVTTTTTVSANVTYYAHWKAKTYTVSFNAISASATLTTKKKSVRYGGTYGALPAPALDGYAFVGWFTERSGGVQVTDTTKVTTAADHMLYARWKKVAATCTVTFNANSGTVSPTTRSVTTGAAVGTLPVPTLDGYDFVGWFTAKSSGTQVTASTKVTANVTYYAHWKAKTFTVSFNAISASATLATKKKTVRYGGTYGALPAPSLSGYAFVGWFTERSGGTQVLDTTKVTTAADHMLYARWKRTAK